MKKYLYLFFVALFATMSFLLTSCGDDDDEPNEGNNQASLTINNVGYGVHDITGSSTTLTDYGSRLGMQLDAELYPINSDEMDFFPRANFCLSAESTTLSKGMTLNLTKGYVEMITDVMSGITYDEIVSGKIVVSEIKGSTVILKFYNLKLSDGYGKDITINGSLSCEFEKI